MVTTRPEKLNIILTLAKQANGKRMSECTEQEQHAVLFLGNKYPAESVDGVPRYSRTAQTYTYACSYVEAREINRAVGGNCKFQSNSFHVYADAHPTFPETSALKALEAYPLELKIPNKPITYENLEPLQPDIQELDNPRIQISGQIARVYAGLMSSSEQMEKPELSCHFVIHKYREQFHSLCENLKLTALSTAILNYEPQLQKRAKGSLEYKDTNSSMSYLATYLYYASKGIYLKVNEDV